MDNIYDRNNLYIPPPRQHVIRDCRILLAGCGIGSNIAECALRLGFENITLVDGDKVAPSNLNRQNYTAQDEGLYKTVALQRRLLEINPNANIQAESRYISTTDLLDFPKDYDIAINALDFQTDIPFVFDEVCQQFNIPVIHPYNFGWAALIFVVMPGSEGLKGICSDHRGFEKKVASYLVNTIRPSSKTWIEKILSDYETKGGEQSPPQLSVASFLAAGACTDIMYRLANKLPVRQFPDYYFVTNDDN